MESARRHTKGFTLIASLLLLLLMSGIAIGLLMMVNAENRVGGSDMQNDIAYHAAEGGIEKMASDLAAVLQNAQATSASEICSVGGPAFGGSAANEPAMAGIIWKEYQVTPNALGADCGTMPSAVAHDFKPIQTGPNAGLYAQIIPISMQATAATPGGQEVSMIRSAQIALIPVFQFGVFSEGDLAFFSTPDLDFNGRVHTNGDLYLGVGSGYKLTFHHKLEAYGNVVEDYIPNGLTVSAAGDTGTVYIPTNDPGCTPNTSTSCYTKDTNGDSNYGQGSVQGMGGNPPQSTYNGSIWSAFVSSTNQNIINGNYGSTTTPGKGARKLSMPFVSGTSYPYEIIRQPPSGEDTSTSLSASREYNMASIHVLLADDPNDLPGGSSDTENIRLANGTQASGNTIATAFGVPIPQANYNTTKFGTSAGNTYNLYFASASNAVPVPASCSTATGTPPTCSTPDWPYAPPATFTGFSNSLASNGLQPAGAPNLWTYGTPAIAICPPANTLPADIPAACPTAGAVYPYYGLPIADPPGSDPTNYPKLAPSNAWSLIDGYLRVEYKDASGGWHPVTSEWLQLGFARGVTPPTQSWAGTPAAGTPAPAKNPINPKAILLLQQPADRAVSASTLPATDPSLPTISTCVAPSCVWAASQANAPVGVNKNGGGQWTSWKAGNPVVGGQPVVPPLAADLGSGNQWEFGITPNPTPSPTTTPQSLTQFNWYPINFYDAREGEARDVDQGNNSCTAMGLMNAVEIDVGNLQQWLKGNIGINPVSGLSSGSGVDYAMQNGYVLYFSDRRGMLRNPNATSSHAAGSKSGDSGFEDVVNTSSSTGTADGVLEPTYTGAPLSPTVPPFALSPEDVNENGVLDNWGTADLGMGFWNDATHNVNAKIVAATPDNPYSPRITSCSTTGRKNWVSGARHVLKLVDGSVGNLPIAPVGTSETIDSTTKTYYGGFTVASENPVYIQGDYNSVTLPTEDTFFPTPPATTTGADVTGYVPAAVIADAVTLLSNNWDDRISMLGISTNSDVTYNVSPNAGNRLATTTSYRVAIAGGKNMNFRPTSSEDSGNDYPFGTDGGVGNFLRFLEDWGNKNATLNYGGSLVSLYYSTYGTGIFKCCEYSVYAPPTRNYVFDVDFTLPGGVGLPPGTPLFRDVETLGYRQMFTTRDSSANQ